MKYLYEAIIRPVEGFGYEAEFPDLDIITQGNDVYDAAFMAQDLLQLWISTQLDAGKALPAPSMDHKVPKGSYAVGIAVECEAGMPEIETMTAQEAADILDVSKTRICAMARDGVLKSKKVGNMLLISTESVKQRFNEPKGAGRPTKNSAIA